MTRKTIQSLNTVLLLSLVLLGGQGWAQQCGGMNDSWMNTDACPDDGPVQLARLGTHVLGASVPVASAGYTCGVNNLVLYWRMESVNSTGAGGCIDGVVFSADTEWTLTGASISSADKTEGSNMLTAPTADYADLAPTTNGITAQGTIWFDFYITTFQTSAVIFRLQATELEDEIRMVTIGGSGAVDIAIAYEGNNTAVALSSDSNLAEDKWYRLRYTWKVSESAADHRMDIWALSAGTPMTPETAIGSPLYTLGPEDSITEMDTAPGLVRIGNTAGAANFDRLLIFTSFIDTTGYSD